MRELNHRSGETQDHSLHQRGQSGIIYCLSKKVSCPVLASGDCQLTRRTQK